MNRDWSQCYRCRADFIPCHKHDFCIKCRLHDKRQLKELELARKAGTEKLISYAHEVENKEKYGERHWARVPEFELEDLP